MRASGGGPSAIRIDIPRGVKGGSVEAAVLILLVGSCCRTGTTADLPPDLPPDLPRIESQGEYGLRLRVKSGAKMRTAVVEAGSFHAGPTGGGSRGTVGRIRAAERRPDMVSPRVARCRSSSTRPTLRYGGRSGASSGAGRAAQDGTAEREQGPPEPLGHAGHEGARIGPRRCREHARERCVVAGRAAWKRARWYAASPRGRTDGPLRPIHT